MCHSKYICRVATRYHALDDHAMMHPKNHESTVVYQNLVDYTRYPIVEFTKQSTWNLVPGAPYIVPVAILTIL